MTEMTGSFSRAGLIGLRLTTPLSESDEELRSRRNNFKVHLQEHSTRKKERQVQLQKDEDDVVVVQRKVSSLYTMRGQLVAEKQVSLV